MKVSPLHRFFMQALGAGVEARLLTQALICPYRLTGYYGQLAAVRAGQPGEPVRLAVIPEPEPSGPSRLEWIGYLVTSLLGAVPVAADQDAWRIACLTLDTLIAP